MKGLLGLFDIPAMLTPVAWTNSSWDNFLPLAMSVGYSWYSSFPLLKCFIAVLYTVQRRLVPPQKRLHFNEWEGVLWGSLRSKKQNPRSSEAQSLRQLFGARATG